MPYYGAYQGDYGTGGYYRGDPGFLSSLWKGVKKVGRIALGTAIGGPVGGIVAGMGVPGRTPPILPAAGAAYQMQPPVAPGQKIAPPQRFGTTQRVTRPAGQDVWAQNGCCPTGYHLAKDGSGRCVRNRRMNPANPRALRRAIRRTDGFVKLAKRALKGTGYAVRRT